MLLDANTFKDELAGKIQAARPDIWNVPATFDLAADTREYALPSDINGRIVSLELKFTSSGDYVVSRPYKKNPDDLVLQESIIVAQFNNSTPHHFLRRNALYILSGTIIAVTDGGKIVYDAFPADISSMAGSTDMSVDPSTTTHGFPKAFHELLERRLSIFYKGKEGMKLTPDELNYENDLDAKLAEFSTGNIAVQETADMPSGESLGGNGFDY